ncbi:GyrI-like domain-containing protein [Clostridium sp. D2Q-14]|uniref:GyrI-like domain-containing protein n=1 Tax=Anaeromonas gelatinilytica TaxID=2683194 RepID=UPI00193B8A8B|nr:GyrI-like domain-containing protein [Anaeromonas gelatinilytica]
MIFNSLKIEKIEPKIKQIDKPINFIGLKIETNDKQISKDISKLGNKLKEIKKSYSIPNTKEPRIFLAVTKNYDPNTGYMEYIMGDVVNEIPDNIPKDLGLYSVPQGKYAVFLIKPKHSFLWGYTLGKMKSYIYREWLPNSQYQSGNEIDDFEYHDHRSISKKPEIDLYVSIIDK